MKEQRDRSIGRGSSETLYENFTNRRSISKSGLSMTRFSSTTRVSTVQPSRAKATQPGQSELNMYNQYCSIIKLRTARNNIIF